MVRSQYFILKKEPFTYKPNSVLRKKRNVYHLSTTIVTNSVYLPTHHDLRATSLCRLNRHSRGLLGISTHKVYPFSVLLRNTVRSYRPFSPLPRRIEAVIFCGTRCLLCCHNSPSVRWCDALRCSDFPHSW